MVKDKALEDQNGFVRIDVCLSNEGIMPYVEFDNDGNEIIKQAYLPKEELTKLTKFKQNVVITNDHPTDEVDPTNSKELTVGFLDGDLYMKGDELWGQLVLTDKEAIEDVKSGKRDVSIGYRETRGSSGSFNGEKYDYSKQDLSLNHLALVDAGRAEKAALSFDSSKQTYAVNSDIAINTMNLKTIILDNGTIEVTEDSVMTLQDMMKKMDSLNKEFEAYKGKMGSKDEAHAGEVAAYQIKSDAQEAKISALETELETLKANSIDASAIDAEITARLEAWDSIGGISNKTVAFDAALSVAQIQRAKVKSIVGDSVDIDSQSDEFVKGMFLALNTGKVADAKVETPVIEKQVVAAFDSAIAKPQAKSTTHRANDGTVGFSIFKN